MWDVIFAGIGGLCFAGTYSNWRLSKSNVARCEEIQDRMRESNEIHAWATDAQIVVRDRTQHTDVMNTTVFALYGRHRDGTEFRNATMLYQNDEFKVYAQSKPKAE